MIAADIIKDNFILQNTALDGVKQRMVVLMDTIGLDYPSFQDFHNG